MYILMAFLSCLEDAAVKTDPVKQLVLELLVSYGGIAAGAAILAEGLKGIFPKIVGQENRWTFLLAFILGVPAKYLFPNAYGPMHLRAWIFHVIVLLFVAVSAAAMRLHLIQKFSGFFSTVIGKGSGGPAAPPSTNPPTDVPPQDQGSSGDQGGGK